MLLVAVNIQEMQGSIRVEPIFPFIQKIDVLVKTRQLATKL